MKWHAILGILAVFCDVSFSIRNGPPYETITFQDKIPTADYTLNGASEFRNEFQSVLAAIGKQNAEIEVVPAGQITSRFQSPQYEVIDVYEISQTSQTDNKNNYQNQYSNNNYRPASPKNDVYPPAPPPNRQYYHHPPPPPEDDDYPPPPPPPRDGRHPPHRKGHRPPPPPPPDDEDDYYDPPPPPPPRHRGPRGPRGPPPHAQAHGHYGHPHGGPPGHNKYPPPPPPDYDHYSHHPGGPPPGRPHRPPPSVIFEDQNYGDRGQGHRPGFNQQPGYENLGEQNIDLGPPEQRPNFNKPNKKPGNNVVGFIEGNFPVILLNDNEIRRKKR